MYNFQESKLSHDFARKNLDKIKKYIQAGISLNLVGLPGVGVSNTVRFLAKHNFALFIYIDVLSLSSLTEDSFFHKLSEELKISSSDKDLQKLINLCSEKIKLLAKKKKVIVIINRFQKLHKNFSDIFFSHLRFIQSKNKKNVILIVTSNRPLFETNSNEIIGSNVTIFSTMYIKPYDNYDTKELLNLGPITFRERDELGEINKLSGGHANLIQLLVRTEYFTHLLDDPFIILQLKTIISVYTKKELADLLKIALGKYVKVENKFLTLSGTINEKSKIFSPLLEEFLKKQIQFKLSKKESLLFSLLKIKRNKIVTKEEIFTKLWTVDDATDWALNALIYRLRNSDYLKKTGFTIENYKGVGYKLIKG